MKEIKLVSAALFRIKMSLVDNSVLYVYHILSPLHIVSLKIEPFLHDIAFPLNWFCILEQSQVIHKFSHRPESLGGEFAEHVSIV